MFKEVFCPATKIPLVRISLFVQGGMASFYDAKMTCHYFLAPEQNKNKIKNGLYG